MDLTNNEKLWVNQCTETIIANPHLNSAFREATSSNNSLFNDHDGYSRKTFSSEEIRHNFDPLVFQHGFRLENVEAESEINDGFEESSTIGIGEGNTNDSSELPSTSVAALLEEEMRKRENKTDFEFKYIAFIEKKKKNGAPLLRVKSLTRFIEDCWIKLLKNDDVDIGNSDLVKEIWIGLSGENFGKSTKFSISFLNALKPKGSVRNSSIVGMYTGPISTKYLNAAFESYRLEFDELQELELMFPTKSGIEYRPIKLFLLGDYKFICSWMGHQGEHAAYPCVYCLINFDGKLMRSAQRRCFNEVDLDKCLESLPVLSLMLENICPPLVQIIFKILNYYLNSMIIIVKELDEKDEAANTCTGERRGKHMTNLCRALQRFHIDVKNLDYDTHDLKVSELLSNNMCNILKHVEGAALLTSAIADNPHEQKTFYNLLRLLGLVFRLTTAARLLNRVDIENVEDFCIQLYTAHVSRFPNSPVILDLHILIVHVPCFAYRHRTVGLFLEQASKSAYIHQITETFKARLDECYMIGIVQDGKKIKKGVTKVLFSREPEKLLTDEPNNDNEEISPSVTLGLAAIKEKRHQLVTEFEVKFIELNEKSVTVPLYIAKFLPDCVTSWWDILVEQGDVIMDLKNWKSRNEIWLGIEGCTKGSGEFTLLTVSFLNFVKPNAVGKRNIAGMYMGRDSAENLRIAFESYKHQFDQIKELKLPFPTKNKLLFLPVKLFLIGKCGFLSRWMGHSGSNSLTPCLYCLVKKFDPVIPKDNPSALHSSQRIFGNPTNTTSAVPLLSIPVENICPPVWNILQYILTYYFKLILMVAEEIDAKQENAGCKVEETCLTELHSRKKKAECYSCCKFYQLRYFLDEDVDDEQDKDDNILLCYTCRKSTECRDRMISTARQNYLISMKRDEDKLATKVKLANKCSNLVYQSLLQLGINAKPWQVGTFLDVHLEKLLTKRKTLSGMTIDGPAVLTSGIASEFQNRVKLYDLLTLLGQIFRLSTAARLLLLEEIDELDNLCQELYRMHMEIFPKSPIMLKLHVLCVHVPQFARRINTVGLLLDTAQENLQKEISKICRMFKAKLNELVPMNIVREEIVEEERSNSDIKSYREREGGFTKNPCSSISTMITVYPETYQFVEKEILVQTEDTIEEEKPVIENSAASAITVDFESQVVNSIKKEIITFDDFSDEKPETHWSFNEPTELIKRRKIGY